MCIYARGGLIKYFTDRKKSSDNEAGSRVLLCSGLTAGEGIVGVLLAILAVTGNEHFRDKIYLEEISASAGISPRECSRCFKRQIGLTPMDYLNQYRVRMAADELKMTAKPVSVIGGECGFASDSYFGKMFRQYLNCTPREYRRKSTGRYTADQT